MNEYEIEIGGIAHTFQLSDEDAKARGLTSKDIKSKDVPAVESPLVATTESAPAAKAAADPKNKAGAPAGDK